jgi:osmotically-inducible protein OsmY
LVRPQNPAQTDTAPGAVGGSATASETATLSKADSELATRVKDAISNLKNKDANVEPVTKADATSGEAKGTRNVEVVAKSGVVTLSGSVDSESERTSMEQAATRVTGVTSVNNYLTVTKSNQQ